MTIHTESDIAAWVYSFKIKNICRTDKYIESDVYDCRRILRRRFCLLGLGRLTSAAQRHPTALSSSPHTWRKLWVLFPLFLSDKSFTSFRNLTKKIPINFYYFSYFSHPGK